MPRDDLAAIATYGAAIGAIAGIAPLLAGFFKKQRVFAVGAFAASICAGAVFGPLVAVPFAVVLTAVVIAGASSFRLAKDGGGVWNKQQRVVAGVALGFLGAFILAVLAWWLFG